MSTERDVMKVKFDGLTGIIVNFYTFRYRVIQHADNSSSSLISIPEVKDL